MSQPHEPQEIRLVLRARFAARDIGRLLKRLREAAQVTQAGLAKKCGIPYQNVSRIERGAREGKISTLNRFARALGYQMEIVLRPIRQPPEGTKGEGDE